MGQKVSPTGLRIGVNKDWESKWVAPKKDFGVVCASLGLEDKADNVILVNRSGVITEGSARAISNSMLLIYPCMVIGAFVSAIALLFTAAF